MSDELKAWLGGLFLGFITGISIAVALVAGIRSSWRSTLVEQGFYEYKIDAKTGVRSFGPAEQLQREVRDETSTGN